MNILIKNCQYLSFDKDGVIKKGSIGIAEGKIKYLGRVPQSFKAQKTIDAKDKLAIPGLINAHAHISMSLLRSYADDLSLNKWLKEKIWPFEAKITDEGIYFGALLSLAEMIKSGTTAFNDMYLKTNAIAEAVAESGLKAKLSEVAFGNLKDNQEKIEYIKETINKWKDNPKIMFSLAPHSAYACRENLLKEFIQLGKELNIPIHIHLSESKKEVADFRKTQKLSPIEYLEKIGLFEVTTLAAHCVHLSDKDIKILAKNKVNVLYCPSSNLKLGNGFAPIKDLLDAKINIALGTDGPASNNNLNMFEEIHLAAIVNKGISEDATAIPALEVIKMATINGAKALGIDKETGSIEKDKSANLILIDLNKEHLEPKHNLISLLVYSAQASDVDTTIVDGKILMENRELKTLDFEKIKKKVNGQVKKLFK